VSAPPDKAFRIFAEEIGSWWPQHYHLIPGYTATNVEGRAGGASST
jgi:hypothetical protein